MEIRELIIKVDDPSERAWDGSSKVFETKELVRCKDCKYRYYITNELVKCDKPKQIQCKECGEIFEIFNYHDENYFCADGEREVSE